MREPERIDRMIEKLRLAWHNYPDQRLCQLVQNIALSTVNPKVTTSCDIYHIEDDRFEIALNRKFGASNSGNSGKSTRTEK